MTPQPRRAWQSLIRADKWPGSKDIYYAHATFMVGLGIFLLVSPRYFFGPSWSYFPWLPHNGIGMGAVCLTLGTTQLVAIKRGCVYMTALLVYLGGVTNFSAGILIGAEGVFGRQGLMEFPWMCTVGGVKFIQSMVLLKDYRHQRDLSESAAQEDGDSP